MNIQIYTDGACSGDPVGSGSWASVFVIDDKVAFTMSGVLHDVTANRAELYAVFEALKHLEDQKEFYNTIDIFCDSAFVVNGVNKKHLFRWVKNNWKNQDNVPIKHLDLWKVVYDSLKCHNIKFHKIRGHSGDVLNSMADQLAKIELRKVSDPKYHASRIKQAKISEAII